MKPQFQHRFATSLLLWAENFFLKKSEAYSLKTGSFIHYIDDRLPSSYETYGSSYKQMIYDSSLPNSYVPSGLYVDGVFRSFEKDKFMLDFENGRFIGSGLYSGSVITGSFMAKDINFYYTNDTEEKIVINVDEKISHNMMNEHTSYYAPYEQKIPAIYLSNDSIKNQPMAFGGLNETTSSATVTIIANNSYDLDAAASIFTDSYNEVIPLVDFDSHPINEYGYLKTGYFSYEDLKNSHEKQIFVKNVKSIKVSDRLKQNLLKDFYIGFVDFELSIFRYRD